MHDTQSRNTYLYTCNTQLWIYIQNIKNYKSKHLKTGKNPIKKWAKDINRHLTKGASSINIWRDGQHHYSSGKGKFKMAM